MLTNRQSIYQISFTYVLKYKLLIKMTKYYHGWQLHSYFKCLNQKGYVMLRLYTVKCPTHTELWPKWNVIAVCCCFWKRWWCKGDSESQSRTGKTHYLTCFTDFHYIACCWWVSWIHWLFKTMMYLYNSESAWRTQVAGHIKLVKKKELLAFIC